jgi:PAS domain S-box-containing protein
MTDNRSRLHGWAGMQGRVFAKSSSAARLEPHVTRLWLLARPGARSLGLGIVVAASFLVVETLVVCSLNVLTNTTGCFATIYLLGVLVIPLLWGFGLSATMSVASAIAFSYFRNWPTARFSPFALEDWAAIAVFVLVALVANALASLARQGERFFDLSPDMLCIADADRVIRVNPAFKQILGYSLDDVASRPLVDLIVPDDRDNARVLLDQLGGSAEPVRFENRVTCNDGSLRWAEWSVASHRGRFYAVGRDVTERHDAQDRLHQAQVVVEASRDELRMLAEQQTALRRVATLVAQGASPLEVYRAVATEMARCLHVGRAGVFRYADDDALVPLAVYHDGLQPLTKGLRLTLESEPAAAEVLHTGRTARIDRSDDAPVAHAGRMRGLGVSSAVGVPIRVGERLWGAAVVGSLQPEPLPADTEARMCDFADLVATSIANAATRDELIASRTRIVTAGDEARRRLERNLHDGAQQRLVSLGIELRMAEDAVPGERTDLRERLSHVTSGLTDVSEELREIARGIHPAVLSKGGLGPALKTLARRSRVPVTVDATIDRRLPGSVEVAAYYVVAEALTNAAKHAHASEVTVCARTQDANLRLLIRDDGIGGADSSKGTGLMGLKDRVEALGGRINVDSPARSGTSLQITIPLQNG